jgi:Zn-dependent metalloprotease
MAGEALEYYTRGFNDWYAGAEINKASVATRYFQDPTDDGQSIDDATDYVDNMNPHYSSGVFNKAFYLLATKPGWNTRKAFEVMVQANRFYWGPNEIFDSAACGVIDAANSLGYSYSDVNDAFVSVNVHCEDLPENQNPPPPIDWLTPIIMLILD